MDSLLGLILVGVALVALWNRIKELERKVKHLEREQIAQERNNTPETEPQLIISKVHKTEDRALPPPLLTSPPLTAKVTAPVPPKEAPINEPPVVNRAPQKPPHDWSPLLGKLGLLPPEPGETSMMAWWTTRIGLGLGVITAVFLGIYVNQNTNPILRLLQLIGMAILVFSAGLYLERKVKAFGQAVAYGGLSLLYVAGYASYGLPAMRITESPWVGFGAQVVAFACIATFAILRGQPKGLTLALGLGYLSSWFSMQEGIYPMPYLSLVTLAAVGLVLYLLKNWRQPFAVSLLGSGGGLTLYSLLHGQRMGQDTSQIGGVILLITALVLCLCYLGALCWCYMKDASSVLPSRERSFAPPIVFGVWLLAGLSACYAFGLPAEWCYGAYFTVALLTALTWRIALQDQRQFLAFIVKAAALLAMCFIVWLDGSTRSFALLGQGFTMLLLARRENSKVLEGISGAAWVIGFVLAVSDLPSEATTLYWTAAEWIFIAFLIGSLVLVWLHQKFYQVTQWKPQSYVQAAFLCCIGFGLAQVGGVRPDWIWAWILPLGVALAFYVMGNRVNLLPRLVLPLTTLALMFFMMLGRSAEWQSAILWIISAWALVYWESQRHYPMFQADQRKPHLWIYHGLLILSVLVYYRLGGHILPSQWLPVWMLLLAVIWKSQSARIPYLSMTAFLPAIWGVLLIPFSFSPTDKLLKVSVILLALLYFLIDWMWLSKHHDTYPSGKRKFVQWSRIIVLCAPFMLILSENLSNWNTEWLCLCLALVGCGVSLFGTFSREYPMSWGGLALFLCAIAQAYKFESWSGIIVGIILLLCVLFIGFHFAQASHERGLYNPRVASTVFGGLAFGIIFCLWSKNDVNSSFLTALWALGAVLLVVSGFLGNLRGYRVIGIIGLAFTLGKLFIFDMDDTFWRIVGFGVSSLLLIGLGYLYNRFQQRLTTGDLDWGN